MKKYSQSLLLLIVVAISITSCKKSNSNSPAAGSGTLLSEYILLDTTQALGKDTLSITYLTYDNLKRLNTVSYIFFTNYVRDAGSYSTRIFFYNGTDTLYDKQIAAVLEAGPSPEAHNDTDYISYDSQGRIIKDIDNGSFPLAGTAYTKEEDYSYIGSTVINNQIDPIDGNAQDTVTQTVSNGNVVSQVDTYNNTCTISLDSHPNPFFKNGCSVTPIYAMYFDYYDADGIDDDVQKNNCTIFSVDDLTGNVNHVINQFTYNANGYPASVIQYNTFQTYQAAGPTGTLEFNFKGIYIYQ